MEADGTVARFATLTCSVSVFARPMTGKVNVRVIVTGVAAFALCANEGLANKAANDRDTNRELFKHIVRTPRFWLDAERSNGRGGLLAGYPYLTCCAVPDAAPAMNVANPVVWPAPFSTACVTPVLVSKVSRDIASAQGPVEAGTFCWTLATTIPRKPEK